MAQETVSIGYFNSVIESELMQLKKRANNNDKKIKRLNEQLKCDHNLVESGRAGTFGFYDIDCCTVCGYECCY